LSLFIPVSTPTAVFTDPAAQLAPFSGLASLAASNPTAALASLSPTLNIFNPAINPNAALLAFNPAAAPTLALTSGFGQVAAPFGFPRPVGYVQPLAKPVVFDKYAKPAAYGKVAKPVGYGKYAKPVVW